MRNSDVTVTPSCIQIAMQIYQLVLKLLVWRSRRQGWY